MRQPVEELIELYQNNLFAVAFNVCKNAEDAEDVIQDVFIQYHTGRKEFESETHIKCWLIRATINRSKNIVKSFWKRNKTPLEDYMETLSFEREEDMNLFESVMKLPEKYRVVIHLFYFEDYSTREIAGILRLGESNVKARLMRGRQMLKDMLREEWDYDE